MADNDKTPGEKSADLPPSAPAEDHTRPIGEPVSSQPAATPAGDRATAPESDSARPGAVDLDDPFGRDAASPAGAPPPPYFPITGDDVPPAQSRRSRLGRRGILATAAAVGIALLGGVVGFFIGHSADGEGRGGYDGRPDRDQIGEQRDRPGRGGPVDEESGSSESGNDESTATTTPADPSTSIEVPDTAAPTT